MADVLVHKNIAHLCNNLGHSCLTAAHPLFAETADLPQINLSVIPGHLDYFNHFNHLPSLSLTSTFTIEISARRENCDS
jgi:hypothetical protein